MSTDISQLPDPVSAYVAAYEMGRDLRQKFGSQNLSVLARDHIEGPYRNSAYFEQIMRGFTLGYQYAEPPRQPADAVIFRN